MKVADAIEFGLILSVSFVFFLAWALLGRLVPGSRRKPLGGQPKSIFAETAASASECASFAFMA